MFCDYEGDILKFLEETDAKIREYGHVVMCIGADSLLKEPQFAYTIGASDKLGCEYIVFGLPPVHAHSIMNSIVAAGTVTEPNKQYPELANMPLLLKECDEDKARQYAYHVFNYYQGPKIPKVMQVVLPDAKGKFPGEPGFDDAYMGPRQKLLYRLPN